MAYTRKSLAVFLLAFSGFSGCNNSSADTPSQQQPPATHFDLTGQKGVDDKLAQMKGSLEHARSLVLNRTDVTGEGLSELKVATRLKTLDLRNTSLTDEDLQNLRGMAQLDYLVLDDSQVTAEGIIEASQFLPRTLITPVISKRQ